MQPDAMQLETSRLILSPIAEHRLDLLHQILSDPHVRRYLCDDVVFPRDQVAEMLSQSQRQFAEARSGLWLIQTRQPPEVIGIAGLWYFFEEPQPQLLYALLPTALKQGYATEAAACLIQYSFDVLSLDYLVASCDRPNVASQKVALRLGMRQTEERSIDAKPIDFAHSSLT